MTAPSRYSPEAVTELLRRTRTDRGLPPVVEDAATVERIATIASSVNRVGSAR